MSGLESYEIAALALDSYQRGYFSGMPDLLVQDDGLGSQIGTSVAGGTIIANSSVLGPGVDVAADFYAVAYLINGEIVISYRGSDHLNWEQPFGPENIDELPLMGADGGDVYAMLQGLIADQVELALEFFNHVQSLDLDLPITLTGHSLGGALAATVAEVKNANAVVFDNTTYQAVSSTIIQHVMTASPDAYTDLKAKVFYGAENPWTDFRQGTITKIALEGDIAGVFRRSDPNVDTVDIGEPLDSISAHIQSLLVLALYARELHDEDGDWLHAANAVFTHLSSDAIADDVGILEANGNPRSGVMKDMIASTILPGTDNPFGSSAAKSLVDDMQDLGRALLTGGDHASVAEMVVRFAALQAKHAISEVSNPGALSYDAGNWLLGVDLTTNKWTFDGNSTLIDGVAKDFSTYLDDNRLSLSERASLDSGPGRIEYEFYSNAVGGWHGQVGYESDIYTVKAVGTGTMDTIIGTDGDEQILLGAGNDTVKANGGVNWIDGGDNDDTFIDDFAWADYEITVDAIDNRYYFALRASGADPRIHVLDNMEFFKLDNKDFHAGNILNVEPDDIIIESMAGEVDHAGIHRGLYLAGAVIADLGAIDGNEHDRFTWEIVGPGAGFYTIDSNGVLRTSTSLTYDYAYWRQQVGDVTFEEWQAGDLTDFAALLGTQYGITVKVTDANGDAIEKDIYLFLQDGDYTLFGTPGNDVLQGGTGRSVIAGLGGADQINDPDWVALDYSASNAGVRLARSGTTDRVFEGYGGHAEGDIVTLGTTSSRYDIIGSTHKDEIFYAYEVFAGGGDDIITGSKIVHAGDGYDTVNVTSYTDYVDFGTGGGALKLADSTQRYFVDMDLGAYQRLSGSTVVHNLTVVGDYDKITGSNYNDTIYGTSGNDRIYGGGGTDTLVGRDGDDDIEGGGTLHGNTGTDTLVLTSNGVAWGDEGADILRATVSGGVLVGGAGDDMLTAAAASVWLIGGAGADTMIGTGTSFLGYSTGTTGVTLTSVNGSGSGSGGDAAGDVFSGILNIEGTTYADNFAVTMQNNAKLWAGAGNDTVIVWHNSNSSQLYGESGDDHITSLSMFGQTFGAEGNDTLIGGGTLDGGTGNDVIIGDNYNGVQIGGDGDDIIDSAGGDDTINFGTGGFDKFIFKTGHGRDSLFGAESHDVVQLVGIAAFDSMEDVAAHMGFNYGSAYLEMGYKDDYPEIYGPNAPHEYIGSIRFFQQSISTVLALDWEFA
ncbi:calcium-binding protein [Devosia sp. LjRoot16]|uniref:calcium-binding protein n=1 Tax=Devosia sp. LjRoot16 TaxID=3342271 RepID=UPI003ECEE8BA